MQEDLCIVCINNGHVVQHALDFYVHVTCVVLNHATAD